MFATNGETIYKTGRNLRGEKLLDKNTSRIKIVNSCIACHGKNGDKMNSVSIKFSYLSNPDNFSTPYTDSLFFRFLDYDLKSNNTKANIGVIWKMTDQDKNDLLEYLKTL
jgi:cytochrome c553